MTAVRRLIGAAVAALLLAGLTACHHPEVEIPDRPAPAPTRLDGTLFFLASGPEKGGIWSLTGSRLTRRVVDDSAQFFQTATVSPDGTRYAWVDGGQLRVAEFGGEPTAVGAAVLDDTFTPQWSPDGTALIVSQDGVTYGRLGIGTGEIEALSAPPQPYVAFSVDGGHGIYGDAVRQAWTLVAVAGDGVPVPVIPVPFRRYTRFQSLAPDGRHAVALLRGLAEPDSGYTRTLAANAVVDLLTGTAQRIPGGGTVRQGFFRSDGGAVLRVSEGLADRVLLISPEGEVVDRADLPGSVSDVSLLGYVPAGSAEPSPTPSSSPSPSPSPSPTPPPALDGTLFFLGGDGLYTVHDGAVERAVDESGEEFLRTVAVSPRGDRYAFIEDDRLRIAPMDGSPVAVGPATLSDAYAPTWSDDGSRLTIRDINGDFAYIDASSGAVMPRSGEDFVAFSPDGAFAVVGGPPPDEYHVVHVQGTPSPVLVLVPEGQRIVRFASLSPDGNHALVLLTPEDAETHPDGVRDRDATAIVDLATGSLVPVPGGGTLHQGLFHAEGGLVLRVTEDGADRVLVVSRTGEVQDRVDLPAGVDGLALLSYAPQPE